MSHWIDGKLNEYPWVADWHEIKEIQPVLPSKPIFPSTAPFDLEDYKEAFKRWTKEHSKKEVSKKQRKPKTKKVKKPRKPRKKKVPPPPIHDEILEEREV